MINIRLEKVTNIYTIKCQTFNPYNFLKNLVQKQHIKTAFGSAILNQVIENGKKKKKILNVILLSLFHTIL